MAVGGYGQLREQSAGAFLIRISFAQQPLKQLSKWKRIFLRQDAGRVTLVCALPAKLEKLSCFPDSGLRGAIRSTARPHSPAALLTESAPKEVGHGCKSQHR